MDQKTLDQTLADLPLGQVRYFDRVESTNDLALEWAGAGAPHLALVVADEQTSGRGRGGRRWYTPPGAALAFSLIFRPAQGQNQERFPLLAGLGGLAVGDALAAWPALQPALKWPNDVLLASRKVAGILPESHWLGDTLQGLVLGIGVNLTPSAVPPAELLDFPATAVETELGRPVDRLTFLHDLLAALVGRWPDLGTPDFLAAWESRLAYRGRHVQLTLPGGEQVEGRVLGLNPAGNLLLEVPSGTTFEARAGEVHLRALH